MYLDTLLEYARVALYLHIYVYILCVYITITSCVCVVYWYVHCCILLVWPYIFIICLNMLVVPCIHTYIYISYVYTLQVPRVYVWSVDACMFIPKNTCILIHPFIFGELRCVSTHIHMCIHKYMSIHACEYMCIHAYEYTPSFLHIREISVE